MIRQPWWLAVGPLLLLVATPAHGLNQTPGSNQAACVQFMAWEFGEDAAMVKYVAPAASYRLDLAQNLILSNAPAMTIPRFASMLTHGYGWWFMSSHGPDDGQPAFLTVEPYQSAAARDQALANYLAGGYGYSSSLFAAVEKDGMSGIAVTPIFLASYYVDQGSFVHVAACHSIDLSAGFVGAKAVLGYNYTVTLATAENDTRILYTNLAGWNGAASRTVGAAMTGTTLTRSGQANVVLNPIVASSNLSDGLTITGTTSAYFQFDTPMNTTAPASTLVRGAGSCTIQNATWQDNTLLTFTVVPIYKNWGSVGVAVDTSGLYAGATSSPGNLRLVGNLNGGESPVNGYLPVGPYALNLTSTVGGDNPAATLNAFAAIRRTSGATVQWSVEAEHNTGSYLVDHAPDWSGPFTLASSVLATGGPTYQVTAQWSDGIYRLREVETTGDTLPLSSDGVRDPFTIDLTDPVTRVNTDSLRQSQLVNWPAMMSPQSVPENWDWVAICPQAWISALQPLANFWAARGHSPLIQSLESIGTTPSAIIAFERQMESTGMRYFLIVGDASCVELWKRMDLWQAVNDSAPPWPIQPANNIIPLSFNQVDTVGSFLPKTMSYFTPFFGGDWFYTDSGRVAVGRFPTHAAAEVTLMVQKTFNAMTMPSSPYLNQVDLWVYAHDYLTESGARAQEWADSLARHIKVGLSVNKLYDTPQNPLTYSQRQAMAVNSFNQGRSLIVLYGTVANRAQWEQFWNKTDGASFSLVNNTTILPFLFSPSCDVGDIDRTENPVYGRPLIEEAMLLPNKGPSGAFGPSRGTFQYPDYLVGRDFLDRLYRYGAPTLGVAAWTTIANLITEYPQDADVYRSYMFIGDPLLQLPNQIVTTGVDGPAAEQLWLAPPWPNPSASGVTLRYSLPTKQSVRLSVYDIQGREISRLADGWQSAGVHQVAWSGHQAPGVYLLRLRVGRQQLTQKMVVLR